MIKIFNNETNPDIMLKMKQLKDGVRIIIVNKKGVFIPGGALLDITSKGVYRHFDINFSGNFCLTEQGRLVEITSCEKVTYETS